MQAVDRLVRDLGAAGIRYCHWKGSEHLAATLAGEGDLDLLFSRSDLLKVLGIFANLGFRPYRKSACKHSAGVMDFVGFDETSGKIVHLHTYFRLVMGDPQLEEYRLPWEEQILATASPAGQEIPMPIPAAEAEILVLLVRSCLKVRLRDRFFRTAFRNTLEKDYERNRRWLCERLDEARLRALSDEWLHPDLWPQVQEAVFSQCEPGRIFRLRRSIVPLLARFRTYGPLESLLRARLREIGWVFGALNKRHFHWAVPWNRTAANGGAIICVLGADGSGKSTLTTEITHWLTWKLDAIPVYMGSGDGPVSLLRMPLMLMRKLVPARFLRRSTASGGMAKTGERRGRGDPLLVRIGLLAWGSVLAMEKRSKLFRARRAANLGMIVIADRYPQAQIFGFNDGPLMQGFATSPLAWLRAIAAWELNIYRLAERIGPDLVIKLLVSPEVAVSRKPEMAREEILRRNAAVESLSFPTTTRVVTISADQLLGDVLQQAKKAIWAIC